jgi:hypothetical protein
LLCEGERGKRRRGQWKKIGVGEKLKALNFLTTKPFQILEALAH